MLLQHNIQVSDVNDVWVGEAVQHITAPGSDGDTPEARELHLCAAGAGATPPNSTANSTAGSTNIPSGGGLNGAGSHMLTDMGLMKLVSWPCLTTLVLGGMPGITLAGVKVLVGGCPTLCEVQLKGCPAVSAAPPESVAKAAVGPGGRVVNVWVN